MSTSHQLERSSLSESPKDKVSVLIVCYRSLELIGPCLSSIYEETECAYEVLLLDCSADGTVDFVKAEFPWVKIIENSENLGFAKGNNVLAEHATGNYTLLLNPDTLLQEQSIDQLLACARNHPDYSAWGGITVLPSGKRDFTSLQCSSNVINAALIAVGLGRFVKKPLWPTPEAGDSVYETVDTLSGAFMMIRTEDWHTVSGFDTSFFLYSEEVDLCHRLSKATGRPVGMFNLARITHLVGESTANKAARLIYINTGKMHYARKFFGPIKSTVFGFILFLSAVIRFVGFTMLLPIMRRRSIDRMSDHLTVIKSTKEWWGGYQQL